MDIILFILRIAIALALYAFLAALLWTILRQRPAAGNAPAASRLTVLLDEGDGRSYDITTAAWIGRDPNCLIRTDDDFASARHAQLLWRPEDQAWWLEDNLSRNGTFVNDERITRAKIKDGDVVRVGRAKFRFEDGVSG